MNFFERQAEARQRTRLLLLLFVLAVCGIVAGVDALVWMALGTEAAMHRGAVLATVSGLTLAFIGIASLIRTASLARGGAVVARELGGTLVSPDTADPRHRRLRNVVEEMAIASGVPVPQIYVLEQEAGINAFAAGHTPGDAAIGVTRGAVDKLSRDELQGVIAHEFSHILNGDMRLNLRLVGWLFGILLIGIVGRRMLDLGPPRVRTRSEGSGSALAFGLLVLGYVGLLFGQLIQAAISRSREYLADASAVQFTRQAAGLAGALKKAAGLSAGTRLRAAGSAEFSHLLFGQGAALSGGFATHPPLAERIRRLDPGFDPRQLPAQAADWNRIDYFPDIEDAPLHLGMVAPSSLGRASAPLSERVAQPHEEDCRAAAARHQELPPDWLSAAHAADRAAALVLALLIDEDPALAETQLACIAEQAGASRRVEVAALLAQRQQLHPVQRLPLAAIAMPSLRRHPPEVLLQLAALVKTLTLADGRVQAFEWSLGRLLRENLAAVLAPARAARPGALGLNEAQAAIAELYAALAQAGHPHADEAARAFQAGIAVVLPQRALRYLPPADMPAALDAALDVLVQLKPAGKALLIDGMRAVLLADGRLTVTEAELLRALCAALGCPLPAMPGLNDAA